MTEFRYADIERQLVTALPEIRPAAEFYWRTEGEPGDDSGAYVFFEDLFAKYVEVLLWLPSSRTRDGLLTRAFGVLDDMLGSADGEVQGLAAIGLLEGRDPAWLKRARSFVGPRADAWLQEYDANWRDCASANDAVVPEILDGYHVRSLIADHLRRAREATGEIPGSTYAEGSLPGVPSL